MPNFDHLRLEAMCVGSCLRTPFDHSEDVRLRQNSGPIRHIAGEGKLDTVDEPAQELPYLAANLRAEANAVSL